MKAWKRNLLIAYLVCIALVIVFFCVFLFDSTLPGFLKFLLMVPVIGAVAGMFAGVYLVVHAFLHEHATLHAGPEGQINIERSALESTASRAIANIDGVKVVHIVANVSERKPEPTITLTVTAVPLGTESLMAVAERIQGSVKRAVESFTDHEVRYVAVNFVEPRKRGDLKAVRASSAEGSADAVAPARRADAEPVRVGEPVQNAGGSDAGKAAVEPDADAGRPSLWNRAKSRVASMRADERDEDVLETEAVVESIPTNGGAPSDDYCAEPSDDDYPREWSGTASGSDEAATVDPYSGSSTGEGGPEADGPRG